MRWRAIFHRVPSLPNKAVRRERPQLVPAQRFERRRFLKRLDLDKYGLGILENKNILSWSKDEVELFIGAFAAEDIAPKIDGLKFVPHEVSRLLSASNCRSCGKCCLPSISNPSHPGVSVGNDDLMSLGRCVGRSFSSMKKMAPMNRDPKYPIRRCLPLPCEFFEEKTAMCSVYEDRPLICRTYPVSNTNENDVTINVKCEYGKDIYRDVVKRIREDAYEEALSGSAAQDRGLAVSKDFFVR